MAKPEKAARNTRTPAERAQEDLDRANRVVKRIEGRIADAEAVLATHKAELVDAKARRDYAALNPALPKQPAVTTGESQ